MRVGPLVQIGLLAVLISVSVSAQSLSVELQRVTQQATVTGDLRAAIDGYKRIVARAGADREVAAQALLAMAGAYEKLGDGQARAVYEQLVRNYADQKDAVTFARAHLGGADRAAPQSGMALRKVVWPSGNIQVGTISQDGRNLTYEDWFHPSTAEWGTLRLRDLVAGTDRPLTSTKEGKAGYFPATSRDGTQVAYQWCSTWRNLTMQV